MEDVKMRALILTAGAALAVAGLCSMSIDGEEELGGGGGGESGGANVDEIQHSDTTAADEAGPDDESEAGEGDDEGAEEGDESDGDSNVND